MSPEMDTSSQQNNFELEQDVFDKSRQDDSCVHVAVRIRPNSTPEGGKCLRLVSQEVDNDILDDGTFVSDPPITASRFQTIQVGGENKSNNYTFDHVFPISTSQEDLYSTCVESLVHSCLEGYNATIFAYGQTGSGKTHSMIGDLGPHEDEAGVIPRALEDIFHGLEQKAESKKLEISSPRSPHYDTVQNQNSSLALPTSKPPFEYNVEVQFLELYGEEIHDLVGEETGERPQSSDKGTVRRKLSRSKSFKTTGCLAVRDGKVGEDAEVIGACLAKVKSADEALNILRQGMVRRRTEKTAMNSESSRSHAIFTLVIQQTQRKASVRNESVEMKTSKIHFVDLAGSERIKSAKTKGKRMQEGININKGLFVLGNVISALGNEKNKAHVPYRDSKLTRLLKGSLGGNHKTLMIACVRDSDNDESINTLRYANRAKNIKNHARVNIDPSSRVINALRNQVSALAIELLRVREDVDDDDGCPFSSVVLRNFVGNVSTDKLPKTRTASFPPTVPRPSTAPAAPTIPSTAPTIPSSVWPSTAPIAIDQFSIRSLKRSRSDSSIDNVRPLPKGSLEKNPKTGTNSGIFEEADDQAREMEQTAFFNTMRESLLQTFEIETAEDNHKNNMNHDNYLSNTSHNKIHNRRKIRRDSKLGLSICEMLKVLDEDCKETLNCSDGQGHESEKIALYDSVCASLRESLNMSKPSTLETLDMAAIAESRNEHDGAAFNFSDGRVREAEQIAVHGPKRTPFHKPLVKSNITLPGVSPIDELYDYPSSSLTYDTIGSGSENAFLTDSPGCPSSLSISATMDSENEYECSINSPNISMEATLKNLPIPKNEIIGNAMTDYQEGYQALKMQNSLSMIATQAKNSVNEKTYLKSIMCKLERTSVEFTNLSRSIAIIDEKISVLKTKRHNILGCELYKRTNKPFEDTSSTVLVLEDEIHPSSEDVGSLGETVSDLEARREKGPPVSSISIKKKCHRSNHSSKSTSNESVSSASQRKYRTIILRCSTFFIRPLIPLLSKRKDDALPYPLRL